MKISKIHKSKYKDQNAITLESNLIKTQFIQEIGSKMCSFIYKPRNLELLIQGKNKRYIIEPYDGTYTKGENSGFDEMFPTIDECYYGTYPWKGTRIPDHGELWPIPWEHRVEDNRLIMEVYGVRFPYRIKKTAYFVEDNTLRIDYELVNLSNFNFDFMWVAHPHLVLEEGSEIILPKGVRKVITTHSPSGRLGRYGEEHTWPSFRTNEAKEERLNIVRPKKVRDWGKYFIKGKMPEGWCALRYSKSNITLVLSFPVDKVPYLAILANEEGFGGIYSILIEPCTASFDRLDVAKLKGKCSSVGPKSRYKWHLNLRISKGANL